MPRPLRTLLPDGFFHVTMRGVERRPIFADADDCLAFLRRLRLVAGDHRWEVHALCLMPNHFHLVVDARRIDLSRGMQVLAGGYARVFNDRHRRPGHLFGGRFDARVIEDENYLAAACAYVVANPVRAGLCAHADEWPWAGARGRAV